MRHLLSVASGVLATWLLEPSSAYSQAVKKFAECQDAAPDNSLNSMPAAPRPCRKRLRRGGYATEERPAKARKRDDGADAASSSSSISAVSSGLDVLAEAAGLARDG